MKARTWAVALVTATTAAGGWTPRTAAWGQENPSPDQMKKLYEEAVGQLKAAQERKNQLAAENEKLGQQVEAIKKDLAAATARLDEARRADAEQAEKTFFLRAHYVAWQAFARLSPETEAKWRAFLGNDYLAAAGREPDGLRDRAWPNPPGLPKPATEPAPATQPATAPTTGPSTPAPPATAPAAVTRASAPGTQPSVAPPPAAPPAASQPAAAPAATRPAGATPATRPS